MLLKSPSLFLVSSLLAITFSSPSYAEEAHWSYDHPEHWGEISKEFSTCQTGKNQSPIEINAEHEPVLDSHTPISLTFNYRAVPLNVENNGHTIKVNYPEHSDNTITFNGKTYELKQFHFHTPPEHVLKMEKQPHFAIEMHLVHADAEGNLAVVGVFFDDEAVSNPILKEIFDQAPKKAEKKPIIVEGKAINVADLLPADTTPFYMYSGSLTTPPCSEGVQWIVLQHPLATDEAQTKQLKTLLQGHDNNRPVQAREARLVVEQK